MMELARSDLQMSRIGAQMKARRLNGVWPAIRAENLGSSLDKVSFMREIEER